MKRMLALLLVAGLLFLTPTSIVGIAQAPIEITFWSAPAPTQEAFWTSMAEAYMAENPNVNITVSAIVEGPQGSEGTILTAIAGGVAPTASGNIFTGFGGQLLDAGAIVPLNQLEGWDDIVATRKMAPGIDIWRFSDGNFYIFPLSSNAMLFAWRGDILEQLGFNTPPDTFEDIIAVGKALKVKFPDKFLWASKDLVNPTWWKRWFDFFMIYNAESDGNLFVDGGKVVADDESVIKVFQFMRTLNEEGLVLTADAKDPFLTGLSIWRVMGPWSIPGIVQNFPELQFGDEIILAPPPVSAGGVVNNFGRPHKTFADAKGVVIYSSQASGASQQQIDAVWEFVRWTFGTAERDAQWFKQTNQPAFRSDLISNPAFVDIFNDRPALKAYAAQLPFAVTPVKNGKVQDIQTALGAAGMIPAFLGELDVESAWAKAKGEIELILATGN